MVTTLLAARSLVRAGTLDVRFDASGLASLNWAGADLLRSGGGVESIDPRHGLGTPGTRPSNEATTSFDAGDRRLTRAYSWGTLQCVYRTAADRLVLDLTVRDTGNDSVFGLTAVPLRLRLPGPVHAKGWPHGWPTPSVLNDAPQVLGVAWAGGTMAVCNEDVDRPLRIDLDHGTGDDYAIKVRHDGPPRGQEITAGDARTVHLSVRFGDAATPAVDLARDTYARFGERYPSELKWDDRRPIGCSFLSSIESRSPTNPTGCTTRRSP